MSNVAELYKPTYLKTCTACGLLKNMTEFNKNRASSDGHQARCRECDNQRAKALRQAKPEETLARSREYQRKRRGNFEYRLQMLLNASKQRAALKGREHTITIEDLRELYPQDGKCPVFGFDLEFGNAGFRDTSPSIDRIDSSKGYTRENIQVISWKANRIKSSSTVEDLEAVLAYMKQGD